MFADLLGALFKQNLHISNEIIIIYVRQATFLC